MNNSENKPTSLQSDRIIKICGLREPDNIRRIAALTPMLMGFIFYKDSPRYAGEMPADTIKNLPSYVRPVAVFVNESEEEIDRICSRYGIRIIQLHGSETPEFCLAMQEKGYTVFKAVGIGDSMSFDRLRPYEGKVTMFVFDTLSSRHGGSGRKFNWDLLEDYPLHTPYLLGGGIGPDDVENVVGAVRPMMAGIDINSGFEESPGRKDMRKLLKFILALRKYNETEPSSIPFWEKK